MLFRSWSSGPLIRYPFAETILPLHFCRNGLAVTLLQERSRRHIFCGNGLAVTFLPEYAWALHVFANSLAVTVLHEQSCSAKPPHVDVDRGARFFLVSAAHLVGATCEPRPRGTTFAICCFFFVARSLFAVSLSVVARKHRRRRSGCDTDTSCRPSAPATPGSHYAYIP